jgi:hypothetical protein
MRPGAQVGTSLFRMCKSVPQIVVLTILIMASVVAAICGMPAFERLLSRSLVNECFHGRAFSVKVIAVSPLDDLFGCAKDACFQTACPKQARADRLGDICA